MLAVLAAAAALRWGLGARQSWLLTNSDALYTDRDRTSVISVTLWQNGWPPIPFVHAKRAMQTNCLFAMIKRDQLLTANKRSTHDGLQPAPGRSLARPCRLVMGHSSVFRLQQLSNIEQLSKNATKNRNCYFRTHVPPSNFFIALTIRISLNYSDKRTYTRPVASLLIALGRFPQILDLFQDLKIEVPSGCLGETSVF